MAMRAFCILLLMGLVGCATTEAIQKNYERLVDMSNGVDEQEAKIIAQKTIMNALERRDYRVSLPDIKTNMAAMQYPDFWFVVFGHNWFSPISMDPLAKTYSELKETQYLVVIDKKTGAIKFNGLWYPKRADNFIWVFDPNLFRKENALGMFPGEQSR